MAKREKVLVEVLSQREEKEHFHQDIELLYVLDGHLDVWMNGERTALDAEDVLIINANKPHYLKGTEGLLYARLMIEFELVSDVLGTLVFLFQCDSATNEDEAHRGLRYLIQKLLRNYLSGKNVTARFTHISICYQIAAYICDHFLIRQEGRPEKSDRKDERIAQIDNYIRANYASAISIRELAEKLYLSEGYLSRFFKEHYGTSFADYLSKVRLYHAVDDLMYTNDPVARIAFENGFANIAAFNKAFKNEYGETPSQARKRSSRVVEEKETVYVQEDREKLEQILWQELPETGDSFAGVLEEECQTTQMERIQPLWRDVINIGAAADILNSDIQEHIILLKEALGFRYVRFWSPFSKELLFDFEHVESGFNFSRLDSVFDFLLKEKLLPFVELANKPRRLEKTANKTLVFEKVQEVESDEIWERLIREFMKHMVSRYGREAVGEWKFELWFDDAYIADEAYARAYGRRFGLTYDTIRHYSDEAEIGGNGMHSYVRASGKKAEYTRRLYDILEECPATPDFISVYAYVYDSYCDETGQFQHTPSTETDFVRIACENLKRQLKKSRFAGTKIYVTEWNLTFSDRNYLNDTCFKGAYIVKNYLDMLGKVDCMAYFMGTDRLSVFYDTTNFLYGGNGLLTGKGILKPAAFAIDFINRLYHHAIGKGSNYLATTDRHGNYGILCHNCKKLNHNYYYAEEDELDRENISRYFEDMDALVLKLSLADVEDGEYQVKTYRINEQSGSVFDLWKDLEYENELSREDIKYFYRVCEPKLSIQTLRAEGGRLQIQAELLANEICYVRAIRLES